MSAIEPNTGEVFDLSLDDDPSTEQITTIINSLIEANQELRGDVNDLQDELTEARRQQAEDRERIEDLEQELEEQKDDTARQRAAIQKRISELVGEEAIEQDAEDRLSISELEQKVERLEADQSAQEDAGSTDTTPTPGTDKDGSTTPQTPLERTVALPEEIATSELTANQERARFVARGVMDYTRSVPAGRAIRSSEIGTVLRAGTECKGRSQTVSRVIEFLDSLGGDGVEVVERRGERRVVFDEDAARRLQDLGGPDAVDAGGSVSNEVVAETKG